MLTLTTAVGDTLFHRSTRSVTPSACLPSACSGVACATASSACLQDARLIPRTHHPAPHRNGDPNEHHTHTVAEDGLTANGRWYGFLIEARPTAALHDGPLRQTWGHGIYENAFVREGDQWLFSKLHFFLNFRTPFEDGWLKTPVIGQHGPDADVPPDEPPTAYHPYPSEYIFKPHFSHPITGERP